MSVRCFERPKLSDLGLNYNDASVFYRTQWKKFPFILFIIYRVVLALYLLGILIAYLVQQIQVFGGQAFIYLTNLGFIVFLIYVNIAAVVAVMDGVILPRMENGESEDAPMRIRHKMHWMFFNITVNLNILVTIIYWGALYNPAFPFFYDFHVHTVTSLVSLLDLFLTPIPVRFLQFIYPVAFDMAYLALTVIFWAAGGRTISSTGAIYPFIDYTNSPGLAAGVIVGIFAAIIIMHGLIWALYKLRVWIWLKCGNEAVTTEIDLEEQGRGGTVTILDPSQVYRPDVNEKQFEGTDFTPTAKEVEKFRQFIENPPEDDPRLAQIKNTYKLMHTHQTVEFVHKKHEQWGKFDHGEFTIMKALEFINTIVDESDPDTSVPNIYHAFQTAERIRERHPDKDWMILTGLIHDLGKVMAAWGEPQWSVVGDTFVVGCAFANSIVYRETSFVDNPDLNNPAYNSKCGMYGENCGLTNVMMSWGHDEYLYKVLVENNSKLPEEAMYMIRYHSFYPWHTGGDYMHLCNNKDMEMLKWVREFNQFDLYSKCDGLPDLDALRPYYQALIDKYIPGTLRW